MAIFFNNNNRSKLIKEQFGNIHKLRLISLTMFCYYYFIIRTN